MSRSPTYGLLCTPDTSVESRREDIDESRRDDLVQELGFYRQNTDTTIVKDEVLGKNHEQVQRAVLNKSVFEKGFLLEDQKYIVRFNIDRGRPPRGSTPFRTILNEFTFEREMDISTAELEETEDSLEPIEIRKLSLNSPHRTMEHSLDVESAHRRHSMAVTPVHR